MGSWNGTRAEAALTTVVATCYLPGVSTRGMDNLVRTLGITGLSKSQVWVMARDLDEQAAAFRTRPLHEGPYTFVAADALTIKVREPSRVVMIAVKRLYQHDPRTMATFVTKSNAEGSLTAWTLVTRSSRGYLQDTANSAVGIAA